MAMMMLQGHGRPRHGKGTLRVTQLIHSQSMDVVKPSSVGSSDIDDLSSRGVEHGDAKSRLTAKRKTGTYLVLRKKSLYLCLL